MLRIILLAILPMALIGEPKDLSPCEYWTDKDWQKCLVLCKAQRLEEAACLDGYCFCCLGDECYSANGDDPGC